MTNLNDLNSDMVDDRISHMHLACMCVHPYYETSVKYYIQ